MSIVSQIRSNGTRLAVAAALSLGLAACTNTFNADVSRFQSQLPPPAGQTFAVVPENPAMNGGLEFGSYAHLVTDRMASLGYTPASPENASLIVKFDYGVDKGHQRITSTGVHDPFFSPWYGYGLYGGRRGFGRFGGGFYGHGLWGYGWNDPWFNDYDVETLYTSGIDLQIVRHADNARLFEGKAEAVSTSNRLQYLVPNLVEAMFTGFPGNSGETVRISVAPEKGPSHH